MEIRACMRIKTTTICMVACMNVTFILTMLVFKDQSFHLFYVQGVVPRDLSCIM